MSIYIQPRYWPLLTQGHAIPRRQVLLLWNGLVIDYYHGDDLYF
uniref:Uncharacterized protein n=1 Tax=Anguilla anguilla TaxID=7936 RepID=A0A0E9UL32_ANGAN